MSFQPQPLQVISQPSQGIPQPSQVTPQPSQVTPQPLQVTPQPSLTISQVSRTHEGSTMSVLLQHSYAKSNNSSIAIHNHKNTTEYLRAKVLKIDFESIIMGGKRYLTLK